RSRFGRSIQALIGGVELINQQKPEALDDIEIILVGDLTEEEIDTISQSTNQQNFILTGQVAYSESLQHQLDANLLLLVIGSSSGVSTTKVYEYLATGNPILALSGPSDGARLIDELKAGLVVEPENADGICSAILHYYDLWKNGNLINTKDPRVQRFDRRELTRTLAQYLDELGIN
ncbi:MAG TPA: glycosyltransferase, partial [Bellilinea sp.]|nr:glycosyltransferase [Bellilinea sp.]